MFERNQCTIEEVFVVKTEAIWLVGSLIRETPEGFSSKGTAHFQDGTHWGFKSPRGERSEIRRKLIIIFEKAAAFYGTKVVSHRFEEGLSKAEWYRVAPVKQRFLH
jgi:hypothetical protein